jgi:hypothetical protein
LSTRCGWSFLDTAALPNPGLKTRPNISIRIVVSRILFAVFPLIESMNRGRSAPVLGRSNARSAEGLRSVGNRLVGEYCCAVNRGRSAAVLGRSNARSAEGLRSVGNRRVGESCCALNRGRSAPALGRSNARSAEGLQSVGNLLVGEYCCALNRGRSAAVLGRSNARSAEGLRSVGNRLVGEYCCARDGRAPVQGKGNLAVIPIKNSFKTFGLHRIAEGWRAA